MKRKVILFKGEKSFTLMEVLIATTLLSFVMLSLFKVKSNNIFMVEKSYSQNKIRDYLTASMDTNEYQNRNENVYLDKLYSIVDDDIRKEFKEIKVKIKDEILDSNTYKFDNLILKTNTFKTSYSFDKGIKKDIYRFRLEL